MALLTVEEFRILNSAGKKDAEFSNAQIERAIAVAVILLGDYVGTSAVTEAEAQPDELRTQRFKFALIELAYAQLAPTVGSRIREGGIVQSERGEIGETTNSYMTPAQIKTTVADAKARAMELLQPYLLPSEQPPKRTRRTSSVVPITYGGW